MKHLIGILSLLVLSLGVNAQIQTPAPSPKQTLKQVVGLTDVTIEYSRPSKKGRDIFATNGLVPFGKLWRFGANQATKLTFSDDVKVDNSDLKAGSYAVLAVPNATEWIINFYPYESSSWSSYKEADPVASVRTKVSKKSDIIESFTMGVGDLTMNSAKIYAAWDRTKTAFTITTAVDERVMADIEKTLAGPTPGDYYAAGNYLYTSGGDMNKALEYLKIATDVEKPRFWQVTKLAAVFAELGKFDEAIKAGNQALNLAKAAGNDDYVKINQDALNKWITMK